MSLPQEVVDTLNSQTARIADLVEHVSAVKYMLAQTMAVAFSNSPNPTSTLRDMQEHFAEKGAKVGETLGESNPGYASAVRVFTSVKSSIN